MSCREDINSCFTSARTGWKRRWALLPPWAVCPAQPPALGLHTCALSEQQLPGAAFSSQCSAKICISPRILTRLNCSHQQWSCETAPMLDIYIQGKVKELFLILRLLQVSPGKGRMKQQEIKSGIAESFSCNTLCCHARYWLADSSRKECGCSGGQKHIAAL